MPKLARHYDRLQAKTAIITGAGAIDDTDHVGTGAAIARTFACEGARVCLVDLDEDNGTRTKRHIEASGGRAILVRADVTTLDGCKRVVDETLSVFGALNILVNNVGGNLDAGGAKVESLSEKQWRSVVDLNLTSTFLMCKAAIAALTSTPGSAIINVSSIAGLQGSGATAYGPAKAGLLAFTKELAVSYGSAGLRANAIAPGHIFTPMAGGTRMDPAFRTLRRKLSVLGIEGDAWDIAAAAVFLSCEEARYITGVCLPVDGGVTNTAPMAAVKLAGATPKLDDPIQ